MSSGLFATGADAPKSTLNISLKWGLHAPYKNIRYDSAMDSSPFDLWQAEQLLIRSFVLVRRHP